MLQEAVEYTKETYMTDNIDLNKLSKEQLIQIVLAQSNNHNTISVADFEVSSTTESLDKCKEIIDSLIKEHGRFISNRNTLKIPSGLD